MNKEFQFCKMKKVLEVPLAQQYQCIYCHCTVQLQVIKMKKKKLYLFYPSFFKNREKRKLEPKNTQVTVKLAE